MQNIEIVIINKGEPPSFEEELAADVIEIITVMSARLYGSRSHKTRQMLDSLKGGEISSKGTVDAGTVVVGYTAPLLALQEALTRVSEHHAKLVEARLAACP
jgi:hypothetical protein